MAASGKPKVKSAFSLSLSLILRPKINLKPHTHKTNGEKN